MPTPVQNIAISTGPLETLIEGCRRNDHNYQEQMYRYCYPLMIGICQRYAGDLDGAGIIFNNAMLRVFKHISRYKHDNKWIPWIKTIVVHCSLDYIKQREKFRDKQVTQFHETSISVSEEILEKVSVKEIHALINRMPRATAAVFNLFIYEGYTHKEIAALLNISEGTSKWHVNEGRKFLKTKLESLIKDGTNYAK